MSTENRVIFLNRFKSFLWRLSVTIAVTALAFIGENIGLLNFNGEVVVVVSLVLSEITKYLNSHLLATK